MHQSDQPMGRTQALSGLRQNAKCKPVDHDRHRGIERRKRRPGLRPYRRARARKLLAQRECARVPAERAKLGDDAPVVDIAAGRGFEVARHREHDLLHHNGASYQARAVGDSATVTRIAASSRPERPSAPVRAAAASWS